MTRLSWMLVLLVVCLSGCGNDRPDVVPVEGTVTYQGEPVPGLLINFVPAEGRPSWGLSDQDGHFVMDYSRDLKGAKVGTHNVWVMQHSDPGPLERDNLDPNRPTKATSEVYKAIMQKFGRDVSELEIEVTDPIFDMKLELGE